MVDRAGCARAAERVRAAASLLVASDTLPKNVPPTVPAKPASRVSRRDCLVVGSAPPATCSITVCRASVPDSDAPVLSTSLVALRIPCSKSSLTASRLRLLTALPAPVKISRAVTTAVPASAAPMLSCPVWSCISRMPVYSCGAEVRPITAIAAAGFLVSTPASAPPSMGADPSETVTARDFRAPETPPLSQASYRLGVARGATLSLMSVPASLSQSAAGSTAPDIASGVNSFKGRASPLIMVPVPRTTPRPSSPSNPGSSAGSSAGAPPW